MSSAIVILSRNIKNYDLQGIMKMKEVLELFDEIKNENFDIRIEHYKKWDEIEILNRF